MINLVEKKLCNGCMACYNICPKKAIIVTKDKAGFLYPKINHDRCISCGKCNQVCSVLHNKKTGRHNQPKIMAAYSKDKEIRIDSTSGGVFSELAKVVFSKGGFVSGAVYTKDHTVRHMITDDSRKLPAIRSSKYLQSNMGNIYPEIQEILQRGQEVLVCGAPCQIMALYNYLGKDYDNLITCDFICRGVNSPRVFQEYLKLLEEKYKSRVTKIKFKNKTYGWHFFSTKIWFANKRHYISDRYTDKFMKGYLEYNLFMRESCYSCPFKDIPRVSDITLADFWGIELLHPEMDQNLGTSMVMLNSDKGEKVFDSMKHAMIYKESSLGNVRKGNPCLLTSPKKMAYSDKFLDDLAQLPFRDVWNKYIPDNTKDKKTKLFINRNLLRVKLLYKSKR